MATLYDLPPELVTLILQDVDSPTDLYALINASPLFSRVYATNRAPTLGAVLKKSFPPAALHDALALLHVPGDFLDHEQRANLPATESFLQRHFSPEPYVFPTDITTVTSLCRIYLLVSHFVDEYFDNVSALITGKPDNDAVQSKLGRQLWPLSANERARLFRAFLRYELYCRAFPLGCRNPGQYQSILPATDQFRLFIARLPPSAVEEMSCVFHFLTSLVDNFVCDVEYQIERAIKRAPGARWLGEDVDVFRSPPSEYIWPWDASVEGDMVPIEYALCSTSLSPFCRPTINYVRPAFLASFGLDMVCELIDNTARRWDIMKCKISLKQQREFFPEAVQLIPFPGSLQSINSFMYSTMPKEDPSDEASRPSCGYHQYSRQRRPREIYLPFYNMQHLCYEDIYSPLRERGYVFWDSRRLATPTLRQSLKEADATYERERHNSRERRQRRERLALRGRVKGVVLPRRQVDAIVSKFGLQLRNRN